MPPAEGYGDIVPDLKLQVERSNFPAEADIQPGMQFEAEDGDRHIIFTVKGVAGDQIDIDGNHPLAGETLHFSVEVTGIREATKEELTHGHAHGEGGAHHH